MARRKRTQIVKLQLRLREGLRHRIEQAAERNKTSLNSEIVSRLEDSFERANQAELADRLEKQVKDVTKAVQEEDVRRKALIGAILHQEELSPEAKLRILARVAGETEPPSTEKATTPLELSDLEPEPTLTEHQRDDFRSKLLAWKEAILKEARETLQHHDKVELIASLDVALQRIDDGTYGVVTEEPSPTRTPGGHEPGAISRRSGRER